LRLVGAVRDLALLTPRLHDLPAACHAVRTRGLRSAVSLRGAGDGADALVAAGGRAARGEGIALD